MDPKKTIAVDSAVHSRFASAVRRRHGTTYKNLGREAERALAAHAEILENMPPLMPVVSG